MNLLRITTTRLAAAAVGCLLGAAGCGPGGPKTYPVSGVVDLPNVDALAGSTVEVVSDDDPGVRAAGEIRPDGRFTLETLHGGVMRKGAREGTYKVRIVPADDDKETRRRAVRAVAPRFLKFETSGLTVQVPPPGDVRLAVAPR